jgi:MFS transporter, BCD family, chlorophyll transporter
MTSIFWLVVKTLRLALPKLGVGWMFALLTINFNRITIYELNITAVAVTAMLSVHYFLSPFQVLAGRMADQHPIFGLRRTPYLLFGTVLSSIVFLPLPWVAQAMGNGSVMGFGVGLVLIGLFGIGTAVMGATHHALIAEMTTPRQRGAVISVVWTFTILSSIIAAGVMSVLMPEYTQAAMQRMYNLTPFIAIVSAVVGVVGMEKRLTGDALITAVGQARANVPKGNMVLSSVQVLRQNRQAWGFFAFIFISIMSIFLQDALLEPFGGEVFALTPAETNQFQPTWGGGVLLGMLAMGVISSVWAISKRNIALVGCIGTALGMAGLATAAYTQQVSGVHPALFVMGLFTGIFNVGALSMMMDMTIEGATGLYMGLWGMAQALGNGIALVFGGSLHTGLIETGLLLPNVAYSVIFIIEAAGMVTAAVVLWHLSVHQFHNLHGNRVTSEDTLRVMEAGLAA